MNNLTIKKNVIEYELMNNNIIFAYRKRDDISELLSSYDDTIIYVDYDIDIESDFVKKIDHEAFHNKDTISNGLRTIAKEYPDSNIILINELTTIDEINLLIESVTKNKSIILADSSNHHPNSLKQIGATKFITQLFNLVHRTKIKNALCNVQAIPSVYLDNLDDIHGDSSSFFINEHFIIKDKQLKTLPLEIKTNTSTDIPKSRLMYIEHCFMIAWVFIKFMMSSFSSFIVDYGLSLLAFNFFGKYIVDFLSHITSNPLLLDIEIISSATARLISSIYVYHINKNIVFSNSFGDTNTSPILKYVALVIIIWVFNTVILKSVTGFLGIPFAIAKIVADVIMYFLSFKIQRDVVFSNN